MTTERTPREAVPADIDILLQLNEAAVPAVNSIGRDEILWFLDHASYFRAIDGANGIEAFMIALEPGTDYDSLNYRWFCDRYAAFAYVDRIVVDVNRRSSGLGAVLYADLIATCPGHTERVTCEVNTLPPNPGSLRFHERLGFLRVGERRDDDGLKAVALLSKELDTQTREPEG